MTNLKPITNIPPALLKVMIGENLTLNDIDNMDYPQFKEFCAQLDAQELKQLSYIVQNEKWLAHIFSITDSASFNVNQYESLNIYNL